MKLPLRIHWDNYGKHQVIDAEHRVICDLSDKDRKFMLAVVRTFNGDWRWRLFGIQPYVYTRQDWLFEKNKHAQAA